MVSTRGPLLWLQHRGHLSEYFTKGLCMSILGYFLSALANVLNLALTAYMYVLIIGALLSWVNPDPYNPIVRFINNVTEPVLRQVRNRLPLNFSGIDFSPMIVILAIVFLKSFLVRSLAHMADRLLY